MSNETTDVVSIHIALGTGHLIFVVAPSLLFGTTAVALLCNIAKQARIWSPITFMYIMISCISVAGPSTYGVLWDIMLLSGKYLLGRCDLYPQNVLSSMPFYAFHGVLSSSIGFTAVLQTFVLKYGRKVTIAVTFGSFVLLVLFCCALCCIFFNDTDGVEIRGSICKSKGSYGIVNITIGSTVLFLVPLGATIASSIISLQFVRRHLSSDMQNSSLVNLVLLINGFNVLQYTSVRILALVVYYIAAKAEKRQEILNLWIMGATYICEICYPVTIVSVLCIHKGLRTSLCKIICRPKESIDDQRTEITSKQTSFELFSFLNSKEM